MRTTSQATPEVISSATALTGELADFSEQIQRIRQRTERLLAGLDNSVFTWQPDPASWSISECLVHLIVTAEQYLPAIDGALETARQRRWTDGPAFRRGWLGRWMIELVEPPVKRRFKATRRFAPQMARPFDEAVPRFMAVQDEFLLRFQQADGLDLWRAKLWSPALPILRFSVGETFAILTAHERRHLSQAENVRATPGFPAR